MNVACEKFVQHEFRKECKNCKRTKAEHPFDPEWITVVRSELELEHEPPLHPQLPEYIWIPRRCPLKRVEEFFSTLPSDKIATKGTPGERHRQKQWMIQIPESVLGSSHCRFLTDQQKTEYDTYIGKRNARNVGEAFVQVLNDDLPKGCIACQKVIEFGELMVTASKAGFESAWHPKCFKCCMCGEQPIDFIHCIGTYNRVFCIRHFDETYRPRCECCDELIFDHDYTKAINKLWHAKHFCCFQCDAPLAGSRFFPSSLKSYCKSCYEQNFRNICTRCQKRITLDQMEITSKGDHWHDTCFVCDDCSRSLAKMAFGRVRGKLYCGKCYDEKHAERCSKCRGYFKVDTIKLQYKGFNYHKECFICCKCLKPIQEKTFIPEKDGFYCIPCYKESYAVKCANCNELIMTNGVAFKGHSYHKECFKCEHCHKPLEDTFLLKNDKPYCNKCFGQLFAKKCAVCCGPIMGKEKFLTFDGTTWHYECFRCVHCRKPLVEQTFVTTEEGIYCKECASAVTTTQKH